MAQVIISEYLWNAALKCSDVGTVSRDAEIVKIHLRSNWLERELDSNPGLLSNNLMCKGCHAPWTCGQFSLRLLPKKPPKPRTRMLIDKDPSMLTKWQQKLRLLCTKPEKNILEIICSVCESVNRISLVKPPKINYCEDKSSEEVILKKVKKKKKKRDSFAGLDLSVVKNVRDSLTSTPLSTPDQGYKRNRGQNVVENFLVDEPSHIGPVTNGNTTDNLLNQTHEIKKKKKRESLEDLQFDNDTVNVTPSLKKKTNVNNLITPKSNSWTAEYLNLTNGSLPSNLSEKTKKSKKKKKRKSLSGLSLHGSYVNTTPSSGKKKKKVDNAITPKRNSLMAEFLNSL